MSDERLPSAVLLRFPHREERRASGASRTTREARSRSRGRPSTRPLRGRLGMRKEGREFGTGSVRCVIAPSALHPEHAEPRRLDRRVEAGGEGEAQDARRVSLGATIPSSHSRAVAK